MKARKLADVLLQQTEALQEVVDVVTRQREALKTGRLDLLQDLMKELHDASFRAQALERNREIEVAALAKILRVRPTLSAFLEALNEGERDFLGKVGKKFTLQVRRLKSEIQILSRLADENKRLGDLVLSEWRRMEGMLPSANGFDIKG